MTVLTEAETAANAARLKGAGELAEAMSKLAAVAGGINMLANVLTTEMLSKQVDMLIELLCEKDPAFREALYNRTAASFSSAAAEYRKQLIMSAQPIKTQ